ncbi:DivIVA domain-containing protein, partial [uncultured Deinococcus sp.]
MKYSPLDIAHQTFRGRLLGYDKAAVHTFLNEAGSQLEDLLREA